MSFAIVTDSTANLTVSQLKEYDITEIVWSYFSENQEYSCLYHLQLLHLQVQKYTRMSQPP